MQLFCKDPNGTGATLTLELPAESSSATTISVVKAQIQAQVPGLCACRLRLMYGQYTELADTSTLADYGIPKEDDEVRCENPQILEQPAESVQSQWKDQKMKEFKLTVGELDEKIC